MGTQVALLNTLAYITKSSNCRFQCECEDCGLVGAESRTNDMMRARIVRCRQEWSTTQSLATERRLVGEQVKLLQRLDCCGRLDYMVQTLQCGWDSELEAEVGNTLEAKKQMFWLAGLGRQYTSWLHGEDSDEVTIWERRLRMVRGLKT